GAWRDGSRLIAAQLLRGMESRVGTRGLSCEVAHLRQAVPLQLYSHGATTTQPTIIHSLQMQAFAIRSLCSNFPVMSWGDLTNTLARIEAAAGRIEDAARRGRHDPASPNGDTGPAAHDRLRNEVDTTLRQLDALIERLSR